MAVPPTLCEEPLAPATPDYPLTDHPLTDHGIFIGASSCSGAHSDAPLQPLLLNTSAASRHPPAGRTSRGGSRMGGLDCGAQPSAELCSRTQFMTQQEQYSPRHVPDSGGVTSLSREGSNHKLPFRRVSALLPHHQPITPPSPRLQAGLQQKWGTQHRQSGSSVGHNSSSMVLQTGDTGGLHSGGLQHAVKSSAPPASSCLVPNPTLGPASAPTVASADLAPSSTAQTPTSEPAPNSTFGCNSATPPAPGDNLGSKQWHELSASTHFDTSSKQQVGGQGGARMARVETGRRLRGQVGG